MYKRIAKGLLLSLLATSASVAELNKPELLRNPMVASYQGYAEFKMGHYLAAEAIWQVLAEQGNTEANFNLGILFEDGLGVEQNLSQALQYYQRAAIAGSSKAQYRLGVIYSAGETAERNTIEAAKWLALAAAQGDQDAAALLALNQHEMNQSPLTSQRDKDYYQAERFSAGGNYQQAADIWLRLAQQGDSRSRTRYAWLLEVGRGVSRDLSEAARLFRLSAEAGDAEAQYALALMLQTGKGQPEDTVAAMQWMCRAAGQGYVAAQQGCGK